MKHKALFLVLVIAAWAVAVGGGVGWLWSYASRPGPSDAAQGAWPRSSGLRLDPTRPTLVIFLHPRCPCSRASLGELDKLLARASTRPSAKAVFIRPAGTEEGWERQGLWTAAAAIPGVETVADPQGAEARRFGVETSGHVLLFAPDGNRLFSGGITSSRGHAGDSPGLYHVLEGLRDKSMAPAAAPVFGCLLFGGKDCEDKP